MNPVDGDFVHLHPLVVHFRCHVQPEENGAEEPRVEGIGRGSAKLVEPVGLTVSRTYEISWKKQTLDLAELARLRFEEGLGSRIITQRLNAKRSTVIRAIHRLERERGLR